MSDLKDDIMLVMLKFTCVGALFDSLWAYTTINFDVLVRKARPEFPDFIGAVAYELLPATSYC